jgi:hypothetical protein
MNLGLKFTMLTFIVIKYGIIFGGLLFQQWDDFHFTKENLPNCGWCKARTSRRSLCNH